jgi:signal transduction histidine kinase
VTPADKKDHGLRSLIELSRELSVSLDFYSIADLALFSLMGQLCTSKSALWIIPPESNRSPVLLRSYGFRKQWIRALGVACAGKLARMEDVFRHPMLTTELEGTLEPSALKLSEQAGIAIYAPIQPRRRLFALMALGHRMDSDPYSRTEVQYLEVALGMVGVALENTGLYNRLLEKHRQITAANENLKELDRLKSEFLRNINHELRTPLTIIIAYLSFLLEQETDEAQRREFLETASEESLKLKGLLEKLLDFSAITRESLATQPELLDLEEQLGAYYQERLPGVAESLHEFSIQVGQDIPMIRVDPQRVRQILDVLVDNAVKFSSQGSRVLIRAEALPDGDAKGVRIDVEDNGPGIDPERLPHVFESFRQGDGSSTRSVGGLGMGLAYAKKLAEVLGGRLEVMSETGRTVFSLFLPTAPPGHGHGLS